MNTSGFATVNPATGERIETFSFYNASQTEEVLVRADKSFRSFRKLSVHQRAQLFSNLAGALRKVVIHEGDHFVQAQARSEAPAWEQMVRQTRPLVRKLVRQKLHPCVRALCDVEDILQEVCLELGCRLVKGWKPAGIDKLGAVIKAIAYYRILKIHRRELDCRKRDRRRQEPPGRKRPCRRGAGFDKPQPGGKCHAA
jgi:hypothetical protein